MKKQIVSLVSKLFPRLIANFAYKQLTNPQVHKLRSHELEIIAKATTTDFHFKGFNIKTYRWGNGKTPILLVHGWEGQAGNFCELIHTLLERDFTIYSFDGPSHGFSSKGETSLFEFTELVGELINKYDTKHLVSHSFGGVATVYSLSVNPSVVIEKYALLTTPDKFSERINDVVDRLGVSKKVVEILIKRLESETGYRVADMNVSDFVSKVNVKSALIIHDKNDKIIPIQQSQNVNKHWRNANLIEIEGTGHFRILRTQEVLDKVVTFLCESNPS
jgi:pimeloyl-ACP methyl ester carboxylesterase